METMEAKTIVEHPALEELREVVKDAEATVNKFSLADAIREGSGVTDQAYTWIDGKGAVCALSAAALSLEAHGIK